MPYVASTRTGLLGVEDDRLRAQVMADVQDSLTALGERALGTIEALETEKARVEARLLAAYGALHTIESQQVETLALAAGSLHVSADRVVSEEIALATGLGVGEVARRLSLATAPRRHRMILAALRSGATTLHRALQVASETAALSDADVAAVEEAVLAPSRDGRRLSQRTFVTRLRRAIASLDTRGSDERRARARSRRGVFSRLTGDGMGCLTLVADADAIAAVMDRLDGQARAARGADDPRTLDQLRCDLATEALLRSHLEARQQATQSGNDSGSGCDSVSGTHSGTVSDPASPSSPSTTPAGLVWLIVPFEVATGTSDAACELPGHGWITAAQAREIMTRPGSVWRTLPVDLRTGEALSRPTKAYRPTAAMVEHVQAVDGRCRGPGCEVLASRCDLDHETPWPRGETSVGNLHLKHRWHHNTKTDGVWTSRPVADGGLEWTTLTGRTYVTHPKDWREGVGPPDLAATLEPAPNDEAPPPF
ncbi:HNH endonuclease signature motif containing protein [Terrabacter ginsenosidimutans]|uniref:HNH endonuclease signature motif containing protein n=1 Tax=Terrabacter ginsenosidimutans TaxID=490575 RepID=A0ABP7CMA4_9MICO